MEIVNQINSQFIIPVVRLDSKEIVLKYCQALKEANFLIQEITLTTPGAFEIIQELSKTGVIVGAGTVLNIKDAQDSVEAGAKFLVSPGLSEDLAEYCIENDILYIPGVATPSEVMKALDYNLKYLKVFPSSSLGGPKYLKNLKGPFPQIECMMTGGIGIQDIQDYKSAGAYAVGLGKLVNPEVIKTGNIEEIKAELLKINH